MAGSDRYNSSLCMPLNPTNPSAGCMKPQVHDKPRIRERPAAYLDLVMEIVQQRLDERVSYGRGRQSGGDDLLQRERCWKPLVPRNPLRPSRPVVYIREELLPAEPLVHDLSPGSERISVRGFDAGDEPVREFDRPVHSRNVRVHRTRPSRYRRWRTSSHRTD